MTTDNDFLAEIANEDAKAREELRLLIEALGTMRDNAKPQEKAEQQVASQLKQRLGLMPMSEFDTINGRPVVESEHYTAYMQERTGGYVLGGGLLMHEDVGVEALIELYNAGVFKVDTRRFLDWAQGANMRPTTAVSRLVQQYVTPLPPTYALITERKQS